MSDLLPCRFCGAAPHAWLDDYINGRIVPDPYYIIECENAGCSVYPEVRGIWPYMDEVRAMWNAANVISQDTVQAQIDAAVAAERERWEAMSQIDFANQSTARSIRNIDALIRKGDQP